MMPTIMQPGDFGLVPHHSRVGRVEVWWCHSRFTHVVSGLEGGYLDATWPRLRKREADPMERYPLVVCSPEFTQGEREAVVKELEQEVGLPYSLAGLVLVGMAVRAPFLAPRLEPLGKRFPHRALVCSTAYTCAVARAGAEAYAKLRLPGHLMPHEVDPGHLAKAWGLI